MQRGSSNEYHARGEPATSLNRKRALGIELHASVPSHCPGPVSATSQFLSLTTITTSSTIVVVVAAALVVICKDARTAHNNVKPNRVQTHRTATINTTAPTKLQAC